MNQTTLIIAILGVVVAIVVLNYFNNRKRHHSPENLKKRIDAIFTKKGSEAIDKTQFLQFLKDAYSCTQKEAVYLLGEAREAGFITQEENQIRLVK